MNPFEPKPVKSSSSKLSAFERLSFTQKQNFNVTWQTKLDEIAQDAELLLPGIIFEFGLTIICGYTQG